MKGLLFTLALISTSVGAQTWTETFKLPEGTTYRARTAGYDCGTFGNTYVAAPEQFRIRNIEFKQLSADKDLNKFLFEAQYPGTTGEICKYGIYLDRNRDDKTLDFTHSVIKTTEGFEDTCLETQTFIDSELKSVAYEGSKRGLRYVAVEIVKTANDVCTTNSVRVVFDRRFAE